MLWAHKSDILEGKFLFIFTFFTGKESQNVSILKNSIPFQKSNRASAQRKTGSAFMGTIETPKLKNAYP